MFLKVFLFLPSPILIVYDGIKSGRLTRVEAGLRLELSYRQVLRSYKRFLGHGDKGLVHQSRGRRSNRGAPEKLKRKVLLRYEQRYDDFGPTLAAEKLAEDGLQVSCETLRRWLISAGLWKRRRKRSKHRSRRERKAYFGELVLVDGSHHHWFGPEGQECCLMNMVDDASGHTMSLLAEAETTKAAMELLWQWIERFGVPKALYTDRKNVFITERPATLEEQLAGEEPKTAFWKACAKLGIEIITAYSPQAKGRVERNHAVYQDRFVKELALRRITSIESANKLLKSGFVDTLNKKFAKTPAKPQDFHMPLLKGLDLADVFSFEQSRVVQNDWTIRYNNNHYQISGNNRPLPKPKDRVLVRIRLNKTMAIVFKGRELQFNKISIKALAAQKSASTQEPRLRIAAQPTRSVPTRSPWRQNCTLMFADSKDKKR